MFVKIKKLWQKFCTTKGYTCVCCGREVFDDERFCRKCLQILPFNHADCCQICGRQTESGEEICQECNISRPKYTAAKSTFVYTKDIVKLLYRFKKGERYLVDDFLPFIDYHLTATIFDVDCIVYVPMHYIDEKNRGYNQAQLLAERIAERYNIVCVGEKVVKVKRTKMQKSLCKVDRLQNLKGSFAVVDRAYFQGKKVLLVDDILTTGATSDSLAMLLKACGCSDVYLYTLASVPLDRDKERV